MSQTGYFSEFVKGTGHGRACLPVLGREKRECLKLPSNSHRLLFAIVVTIESEEGSFPIVQCQPVLFFASQARRRVCFDGGILSTVKEYILGKNGEKEKP